MEVVVFILFVTALVCGISWFIFLEKSFSMYEKLIDAIFEYNKDMLALNRMHKYKNVYFNNVRYPGLTFRMDFWNVEPLMFISEKDFDEIAPYFGRKDD